MQRHDKEALLSADKVLIKAFRMVGFLAYVDVLALNDMFYACGALLGNRVDVVLLAEEGTIDLGIGKHVLAIGKARLTHLAVEAV